MTLCILESPIYVAAKNGSSDALPVVSIFIILDVDALYLFVRVQAESLLLSVYFLGKSPCRFDVAIVLQKLKNLKPVSI